MLLLGNVTTRSRGTRAAGLGDHVMRARAGRAGPTRAAGSGRRPAEQGTRIKKDALGYGEREREGGEVPRARGWGVKYH